MTWQGGDSVEATRRRGDPIEMPEFVFDLIVWAALVATSYVGVVVVCIFCNLASDYVITFELRPTYIHGTKTMLGF